MIQVLLVDDDALFRTSLAGMADWRSLGCRVAFQADNGRQAIDIIDRERVDLLITDMDMPLVNGVELIRYLRQSGREIPCLALSGYDDFHYVREGMRLGASDYLLKHMLTRKSLEQAVLDATSGQRGSVASTPTLESVRDPAACDLLRGRVAPPKGEPLEEILPALGLCLSPRPLAVILVQMRRQLEIHRRYDSEEKYTTLLQNAKRILLNIVEKQGDACCFLDRDDSFYLLVGSQDFSSTIFALNSLHACSEQIAKAFRRFLEIDVTVQTGQLCHTLEDLPAAIQSAMEKLERQEPEDRMMDRVDAGPERPLDLESERKVLGALSQPDKGLLLQQLDGVFQQWKASGCSRQDMVRLAIELLAMLQRECRYHKVDWPAVCPHGGLPVERLAQIRSYRELAAYVTEVYGRVHQVFHHNGQEHPSLVEAALRQIRSKYAGELTLSLVADTVGCNPSYLSRTFKQAMGCGFAQYLTTYRLEQAMALLRSGVSVKQAAADAGFQSYNYFFRVFKAHTAMTPQEYIEQQTSMGNPPVKPVLRETPPG